MVRSVRDTRRQAWRWPITLTLMATVLWVIGLNLYASRLKQDVDTLRATMTQRVQAAFPELPVVVDPLRQAEQGRRCHNPFPSQHPQPGSEQAQQEAVLMELGTLSAATFSNSILSMGNGMKVQLERE